MRSDVRHDAILAAALENCGDENDEVGGFYNYLDLSDESCCFRAANFSGAKLFGVDLQQVELAGEGGDVDWVDVLKEIFSGAKK